MMASINVTRPIKGSYSEMLVYIEKYVLNNQIDVFNDKDSFVDRFAKGIYSIYNIALKDAEEDILNILKKFGI